MYLLFSTKEEEEEEEEDMHPYTSNYPVPVSPLYHPSLSSFVHPLIPSVNPNVMPPFPFFHGSPDRFTGIVIYKDKIVLFCFCLKINSRISS